MPRSDKLKSPEQLNNYIRVTNPGAWIILSAILIFLAGFFFWLFNGHLEVSFTSPVLAFDNDEAYALLTVDNASKLKKGMIVRIPDDNIDISGTVESVDSKALTYQEISDLIGDNNALTMGINHNDRFFSVHINIKNAPKKISRAVFVLDTVRPLEFLLK
ncbi:MAG: hypothetical protein IJP48_04720 [Synergistaceae bacterium]|nr:hypothetical protein [Synergistaceae bacterium]